MAAIMSRPKLDLFLDKLITLMDSLITTYFPELKIVLTLNWWLVRAGGKCENAGWVQEVKSCDADINCN